MDLMVGLRSKLREKQALELYTITPKLLICTDVSTDVCTDVRTDVHIEFQSLLLPELASQCRHYWGLEARKIRDQKL